MVRVCRGCGRSLHTEEIRKTPRVIAPTYFCPDCGTQLARTGSYR